VSAADGGGVPAPGGEVPAPPGSGLGRNAAILASGTAVSRVLGVVRTSLLFAAIGGVGLSANAFDLANKLPNMITMLVAGGVLNAVLVPQVVRAYQTDRGDDYTRRLLTLGALVLLAITVLFTAGAGLVVHLFALRAGDELRSLATVFAVWCIPQVFFYGMYTLFGHVLNARGRFGPFTWAPVANNLVAIAGLLVFIGVFGTYSLGGELDSAAWWTGPRVALLAGFATLGVVVQALVMIPPLRALGLPLRPKWGFRGVGLGSAGRVAGWTFAALVVGYVGVLFATNVQTAADNAAEAAESVAIAGNAAYTNAFLVAILPHSLITTSLVMVMFTQLSAHAAAGAVRAVRADFAHGLRVVGVFTVFASVVLAVLALPVIRIVFPSADPGVASATARVVVAFVAWLVLLGAWALCQRVYYAYEDARTLFFIQSGMAVVVALGALASAVFLPPQWWVVGVVAGQGVSHLLGVGLALVGLRRRLGSFGFAGVVQMHVRAFVAAGLAGGVGWVALHRIGSVADGGFGHAVLTTAGLGLAMGAAYLGLLRLMRVRELADLAAPLLARLRRRGRGGGAAGGPGRPGGPGAPGGPSGDTGGGTAGAA